MFVYSTGARPPTCMQGLACPLSGSIPIQNNRGSRDSLKTITHGPRTSSIQKDAQYCPVNTMRRRTRRRGPVAVAAERCSNSVCCCCSTQRAYTPDPKAKHKGHNHTEVERPIQPLRYAQVRPSIGVDVRRSTPPPRSPPTARRPFIDGTQPGAMLNLTKKSFWR